MSQKLPANVFKWFYDEDSHKGYIFEVNIEYPKSLHNLHSDLPFLARKMKIKNCNKLVCNLNDKKEYVVHIKAVKQALNHGLTLRVIHNSKST